MFSFIRSFRGALFGLNAIQARFDILQNKLDEFALSRDSTINVSDRLADLSKAMLCNQLDTGKMMNKPREGMVELHNNEAIRIVFILQDVSVWSSWRSVWQAANKDPRIIPKVVLSPFIHSFSSAAFVYDKMRQCLIDEQIPFCTAEAFDVDSFNPHVVFVPNPYEETRPEHLRVAYLKAAGARIAYIPYGLEIGGGAWNISAQFDALVHRNAWRIFARSVRHKNMYAKYCRAGNSHVVVTGHPKFDAQRVNLDKEAISYAHKIRGRKVVLWTPHFSVGNLPAWATYELYSKFILAEISRRQDLFLLIRPHPMFFQVMRQRQVWDAEGETEFRQKITDSDNMAIDEGADYNEAFLYSDALMADVGSFLLEYLPTGKPLLYLHHPDGLGMNDDREILKYIYTATKEGDITSFLEMVTRGEDPRALERQSILSEFLFGLSTNIGEVICQHICSSISNGDVCAPNSLVDAPPSRQSDSENFWRVSQNTYLAPSDYYQEKEKILCEVMKRLPSFKKVIDIGCGDGRFTFLLAKYCDKVTGYDISPFLVEKAKSISLDLNVSNINFVNQEIEAIVPFEKYDLLTCLGVTSCIVDDLKFLRVLDKFKALSKSGAHLILSDSLSSVEEQSIVDQSGYIAKYRSIVDYRNLLLRRNFILQEEILIKEDLERKRVNKLFVFEFNDQD